ncbi:hypothetical protein ACFYV7_35630 [Nocardia suismassiliense]|uniref:Excreted virulence factor EspC, type VII ESX diderm n=1 Tax=Nocardia suismassiliense TaxID=2077092 RepID=A0ABW6R515_9NOCA
MALGSKVRVRPEDLVTLADRCIDFATDLTSAVSESAGGLTVAARDAGDTDGGYKATATHGPCVEAAHGAIESLAAVLEADAEALMLSAFAFSDADEAAAKDILASTSAPTGPRPTPPPPPR